MRPRSPFLRVIVALFIFVVPTIATASHTAAPQSVTVAGSMQKELGCPDDWQPPCETTFLTYDSEDDVWQKSFNVPHGAWEYKAALNKSWGENYGANAAQNGPNILFSLDADAPVKFYYDHKTHWITNDRNAIIAVAAGSFQSEIGCAEDWAPGCLRSWLEDPDGDGIYTLTKKGIAAGNYEVKVAIGESWDLNYGADGAPNGANIPFSVAGPTTNVTFSWNSTTKVLTVTAGGAPPPPAGPKSVTIPGSLQSEAGCASDWDPACAATHLTLDANDDVWQGTFSLPAGDYEYKAAIDDKWDENYGLNATRNGPNIPLQLARDGAVKFYYDHKTHWVTSNRNSVIATVPGSFQSEIGCSSDWDPGCLRSWLQDPDGDGLYTLDAKDIPAGSYEAKVAINESWDENYGANGVAGGDNIPFEITDTLGEVYFTYNPTTHILTVSTDGPPKGSLKKADAHWVSRDTIAWDLGTVPEGATFRLYFDPNGDLLLDPTGITGGDSIELTYDPAGLSPAIKDRFPQLSTFAALRIAPADLAKVPGILRGEIAVTAKTASGKLIDATTLQIPGVLDDLYTYRGPLGVTFSGGAPTIRVWAPTAKSVQLLLFDSATAAEPSKTVTMSRDNATGVWSATGDTSWKNKFYLFAVDVYTRATNDVAHNVVTDPYSLSLSTNSQRSQIVDLSDSALQPNGWASVAKPALGKAEDIVLYELHVRDFSANDATVPAAQRGTFMAFTQSGSNGMKHLKSLAAAGLTHVHLLPTFDFVTVNEDKSAWKSPGNLSSFAPDSEEQQAALSAIKDEDGFNWGYDPWHYTVPEGSYSTDPNGSKRIFEFRSMVQAINQAGLRVVMDVVYNHTNAAGQGGTSVLDRIVPGYYHRLNAEGEVENSTCCANTATEHNMMEKLMVDSVVTWARDYKVDGFRFDIMGHHMKRNMFAVRNALNQLTLEKDGVDGQKIYVYGEGWNFGEVADDARGVNATQANMAGTGVGTFNDRMRDGVRGGGPFSGVQEQGFATGLFDDPNATNQGDAATQKNKLLLEEDWIRAGLAGSIKDFRFQNAAGATVKASEVDYNGQPAGYTEDPQEVINYVSAHDNETIFDAVQLKAPQNASMSERVRRNNLALDLVMLSQGVPFFHAGDELLRSKSLDRNSYNSGDWFNKLDYTYTTDNWGVGVPPAQDNQNNWPVMKPLLGDTRLKPTSSDIKAALNHFTEMLQIRKGSQLFRLPSAPEVRVDLQFHNTGPDQVPGVIVMSLRNRSGMNRGNIPHELIVVVFNARRDAVTLHLNELRDAKLALDPVQANGSDAVVKGATYQSGSGTFTVPGLTTAVFSGKRAWWDR